WTMPLECAASRASAICTPRSSTCSSPIGLPAIRCRSVSPPQQFHGDKGSPVGFVNLIDGADVGVVQRGCGLGFPLKTAQGHCVLGEVVGKELQGDVAAELQVFRLVHNTHPAAAELLDDAVVRDGLADHAEEAC